MKLGRHLGVGHGAGTAPGTAGLALFLLAGAQGTLSGQHNLGAQREIRGSPPSRAAGGGQGCPSSGWAGSRLVCLGHWLEWESCGQDKRQEGSGVGAAGPRASTQPCGVQAGCQTRGGTAAPDPPNRPRPPSTPLSFPSPTQLPPTFSPWQLPGPCADPSGTGVPGLLPPEVAPRDWGDGGGW